MMSTGFLVAMLALLPAAYRVLDYQQEIDQALGSGRLPTRDQLKRMRSLYDMSDEQVERARQGLDWGMTPEQQRTCAERLRQELPEPPVSPQPSPEEIRERELTRSVRDYYAAVERQKWRGIPPDMRGGLRVDRWGTVWVKNPNGSGWREEGSEGAFEIKPNSSW